MNINIRDCELLSVVGLTNVSKWGAKNTFFSVTLYNFPEYNPLSHSGVACNTDSCLTCVFSQVQNKWGETFIFL